MISDTVLVAGFAAISSIVSALVALAGVVLSLRNSRKMDEVKKATDGMKSELVKVTRSDALQEGHTAGVKDEKAATKGRTKG